MRLLAFALTGSILLLAFGLVQAKASPEATYKAYTARPATGMTRREFQHYLRDTVLSPSVKRLYEKGTGDVVGAVDADTGEEAERAFTRQSVAPGEGMSLASFKDYITAFPPRKTIASRPEPTGSGENSGPPGSPPAPNGFLDRLTNSWLHDFSLHLTRSAPVPAVPGGADPGPAQLSWTHSAGSKDLYTADAALSYTYEVESLRSRELAGYFTTLYIVPSFEAHTSNDEDATQDSLKAKLDFQFALNSKDQSERDLFQLQALSVAPNYERDRVKATETYGADIFYTPLIKGIPGMSALYPLTFWQHQETVVATPEEAARIGYPGFIWSPSVGFEVGHATKHDVAAYGNNPDYARFAAKVKLDLYLAPQFDLSISYTARVFLTGEQRSYGYLDIAPTWYLGSLADLQDPKKIHFAIGLDFKNGESTPSFKHVDSVSAFIGIKF